MHEYVTYATAGIVRLFACLSDTFVNCVETAEYKAFFHYLRSDLKSHSRLLEMALSLRDSNRSYVPGALNIQVRRVRYEN